MGALRVVTALLRQLSHSRAALAPENLALRHQIVILQRSVKRPRLHRRDRVFWVWLFRLWRCGGRARQRASRMTTCSFSLRGLTKRGLSTAGHLTGVDKEQAWNLPSAPLSARTGPKDAHAPGERSDREPDQRSGHATVGVPR